MDHAPFIHGSMPAVAASAASGGSKVDRFQHSFNATATIRAPKEPNGTELCGSPPDDAMKLLRPQDSDLPWSGMIFGLAISSIWDWCSDQVLVFRWK